MKQKVISNEERQKRIENTLMTCGKNTRIAIQELKDKSRARHISSARSEIDRILRKELGISYAEIARGVSSVAAAKMMKKEYKV